MKIENTDKRHCGFILGFLLSFCLVFFVVLGECMHVRTNIRINLLGVDFFLK